MKERTDIGLSILKTAVLVGVLADLLLRATPWGVNVTLFNIAFAAGMIMLLRRANPEALNRQTLGLFGAWMFFAAMFAWRDSIELRVADTVAIVIILSILFLPRIDVWPSVSGAAQYVLGFIWSAANAFASPFILLVSDIEWSSSERTGLSKYVYSALRGFVIAAPLLVIFGALFIAADAAFQGLMERAFDIKPEVVFTHVFLAGGFAWLSAGYLRGVLLTGAVFPDSASAEEKPLDKDAADAEQARDEGSDGTLKIPDNFSILDHINRSEEPNVSEAESSNGSNWTWAEIDNSVLPHAFTLGSVEIGVVLGLLNLLFLSFVIVQTPYLFGGMELVQNTPDYKLAEYARRGFGELVAVAALVLPVLLAGHWLVRNGDKVAGKLFRVLAGVQIALLFVIMASAVQRLVLLTGPLGYGLTTVRLYPLIFMTWLAVVFVWFCATVLRGARKHFAWGALWAAIVILGATHLLDPDAFIVKNNLELMRQGRPFDATYNSELSDDAIPQLIQGLPAMPPESRCEVGSALHYRYRELGRETDLRSLNYSRQRAFALLRSNDALLHETPECPPQYSNDMNAAQGDDLR